MDNRVVVGTGEKPIVSANVVQKVRLTGHGVVIYVQNGNHVTFVVKGSLHLRGVSLSSGTEYVGHDTFLDQGNFGRADEETFIHMFRLISKGPGENHVAKVIDHYTISHNGRFHADFGIGSFKCTG